jgi:hypothetical protein
VLWAATLSELPNRFSCGQGLAEITNGYALFCTVQGSGPVREDEAMRRILSATLGFALGLYAASSRAEEFSSSPMSSADTPLVTLGRPVPLGTSLNKPSYNAVLPDGQLRPAAYTPPAPANFAAGFPAADPSGPTLAVPPLSAPGIPASAAEQYNCGVVTRSPGAEPSFWDKCKGWVGSVPGFAAVGDFGGGRPLFQSDHAFDGFISPVTNPFYFEDPRSLTEVRPMFIYQGAPTGNPIFHGGDIEYLGLQARLAITDCFSVVMTKFGEVWTETHHPNADFQSHAGFAEIIIGPKYTFLRSEATGTLGAVGLNFDIPAGSRKVLQNTGSLTLEPYISMGQSFCPTTYGGFHALGTLGYNASVDNQRSDNLFLSLHLDFDYGDLHKIYPFLELNWFYYTTNGKAEPVNFEGRDLFNFGARTISGHNEVTLAPGIRYKVNECIQMGFAAEFPLNKATRSVLDYRVMFDLIFRY